MESGIIPAQNKVSINVKSIVKNLFLALAFCALNLAPLGVEVAPTMAAAGINHTINFQGKLVNPNGTNVADGNYSFVFTVYDAASGGTNKWSETKTLALVNGIFQTALGDTTSLPNNIDFNTDNIYLGIKVGADAEMTPRVQFGAVAQAFNSEKLGGLTAGQFIQLAQGVQNDSSAVSSIFVNKTAGGSSNVIELQKAGADVLTVDNNGTTNLQAAAGNNATLIVKQASTALSGDIFTVAGTNGTSKFIQVASTAANAGTVTVQSIGAGNSLTLDSGSGTLVVGATTTTIQKSGTALSIDLLAAASSTLTITNSNGSNTASLSVEGGGSFGGTLTATGILNANATGKTAVTIADSGAQNSGITIGGDTNLYRSAAATLKTDNNLVVGTIAAGGTNLLCYDGTNKLTTCSAAPGGGVYLAKNSADTSSAAIGAASYLYTFTNSSSAVASGVLKIDNGTNTNPSLVVTASGNPTAGNALIFASNTNASPSGNLLDLQSGSTPSSVFSVSSAGVVQLAGGQTADILTANSSSGNATNLTVKTGNSTAGTGNGGTINLTGGDATGTTTATGGAINLTGGSATGTSGTRNGGSITILAGNSNGSGGGTRQGGSVSIDAGTGNSNGTVSLGNTNAATVSIANANGATVNIAANATAHIIHVGDGGTAAQTLTLGSTSSTSKVTIQGGTGTATGDIVLQTAASGIINLGANAVSGKVINIGSVGTTANTSTIHIADSSDTTVAQLVTIGSSGNAASAVTLQAGGTGGINLNSATVNSSAATLALFGTPTTINFGLAAGTLNIGPAGATAATIAIAGGSAATGCTVDGATGNLACSGDITGNTAGTVGYFSRSGTTLQPATAGDNITTSGNISTTSTGTITAAGVLNANATGKTAISIADSGAQNSGLTIGGDTNLYRSAADTLKTDDSLIVSGSGNGSTTYGALFKNTSNSTTALQVQNSAGTSVFGVDTVNSRIGTADTSAASINSNAVTLASGNATGTTSNSGNISIDSGTATGTTGAISLGTTNASAVTIARTGITTAIPGGISTNGTYSDTSGTRTINQIQPNFNPTATSTATFVAASVSPTVNFSNATPGAGNVTALLINPTWTAVPTGNLRLLDLQNGGASVLNVTRTGIVTVKNTADTTAAFVIQNQSGAALFTADNSNLKVKVGSGTPLLAASTTGGLFVTDSFEVLGLSRIGNATDKVEYDATTHKVAYSGAARQTRKTTLVPEYPGAVMTGDGTNNIGTMSSDFCSGTSRLSINTSICAATDEHNYYSWTAQATNDYDIYLRYQLPADFDGFFSNTSIQMYGWRSTATEKVEVALFNSSGTQCGSTTEVNSSNTTWQQTAMTGSETTDSACTVANMAPGSMIEFRVKLTVGTNNNFARVGAISFDYWSKF